MGGDLRVKAGVQAQAEVGVFRAVFGGLFDGDLVETDLAGALAAQAFERDCRQAEMALGQLAEVVSAHTGFARFEHVGFQQRIVGDAAQGDAVVGKDVFVVLQMLADLGVLRRFQPGLQAC